MKLLACLLVTLAPTVALADVSYNAGTDVTHDCAKDGDVSVNASAAKFTFIGTCDRISLNGSSLDVTVEAIHRLSVNGSGNTVAITAVDRVSVNGSGNTVTYKKPLKSKKPRVSSLGTGNKITKVK